MCPSLSTGLGWKAIYNWPSYHIKLHKMSLGDQSDWYGKSPNLPSVVAATSEGELETSLSSIYKVIICAKMCINWNVKDVHKFTMNLNYEFT